jgi:hypothetical protein
MKIKIIRNPLKFQKWSIQLVFKNGKTQRLTKSYSRHQGALDTAILLKEEMKDAVIVPFKITK